MSKVFAILAAILAVASCLPTVLATDWAVLVAGSNTYSNYRHQADIAHAYQLVRKNGLKPENIITFVYDDIATHSRNPYPGQVFNKPTDNGVEGVDVWANMQKDYTGASVNPQTFLAVLTGNEAAAGGKVLKSTHKDRVFIYFSDHGSVGLIAFPSTYLYAKDLIPALQTMYANSMYAQLVFYLEACESGSMFEGLLPDNLNIYVTTAANARESSWGTYCPPQDKVNGKSIGSCLGDLYSVVFLENSETPEGPYQTLQEHYVYIRNMTTKSHVMQYGTLDYVNSARVGDFLGYGKQTKTAEERQKEIEVAEASAVSSRDIPVHTAYYRYLRAPQFSQESRLALAELRAQLDSREAAENRFRKLADLLTFNSNGVRVHNPENLFNAPATIKPEQHSCISAAVEALHERGCGYDDHSLQFHRVIVNACGQQMHHQPEVAAKFVVERIMQVC